LNDSELRTIIDYCEGLLKKRDAERKAQALTEAKAILAAAGLALKDLNARPKPRVRVTVYRNGHHYQHPTKPELVWNGFGKKPNWLRELESDGEEAVEVSHSLGKEITPVGK